MNYRRFLVILYCELSNIKILVYRYVCLHFNWRQVNFSISNYSIFFFLSQYQRNEHVENLSIFTVKNARKKRDNNDSDKIRAYDSNNNKPCAMFFLFFFFLSIYGNRVNRFIFFSAIFNQIDRGNQIFFGRASHTAVASIHDYKRIDLPVQTHTREHCPVSLEMLFFLPQK